MYTTLGMSGNFKLQPSKHTRIAFYFDDDTAIYYNDMRNFGTVKFVFENNDHERKLRSIGPDMLNNPCTFSEFVRIAGRKPEWTIVKWLMDQGQISGVGNIYKSESLFLADVLSFFSCSVDTFVADGAASRHRQHTARLGWPVCSVRPDPRGIRLAGRRSLPSPTR